MRHLLVLSVALLACACSKTPPPAADGAPSNEPAPAASADPEPTPPAATEPVDEPQPTGELAEIPTRYRGRWASDAQACAAPSHESRLVIGARDVAFYEGSGTVKTVTEAGDTLTVAMTLMSEGTTSDTTRRFTLSDDGARLTDDGQMSRVRCG